MAHGMQAGSGSAQTSDKPRQGSRRPDIANRRLIAISGLIVGCLALYFSFLPLLPEALRQPGSPIVYLVGVAGTVLLLVSVVFVVVKRAGRGGSPVVWFIAHVVCANVGLVLVAIHTTGKLDQMPALLLLNLIVLMALGVWARVSASRAMADPFGTKLKGFTRPSVNAAPGVREELRETIDKKSELLKRLDPAANEATFSVTLAHFLRRPADAARYLRLAQKEQHLIGARNSVGPTQAWWRPLHLLLAVTFIFGVIIHIVMVTFFAGYVADGGAVTWWHISAWDF